ncbi:MAG: hypothetical protein KGL18_02670 [Burkholderiales bacterium]|nr:hypothetical protein [Burkholderiales bacterium]MDE1927619.1 hypothetical protein [Burkholderiales bacterium]MDE2160742.1 hypothetical protein [Burkholderiales bacterium]MDE2501869.1 hypothetical protein [Burkholderiales bacterium]
MASLLHQKLPQRLHVLAGVAGLLERLEREPGSASAEQYRRVARQLEKLLEQAEPDENLKALLDIAPAASEIYENMRYGVAGLCRSPLEPALNAELAASAAIERARR